MSRAIKDLVGRRFGRLVVTRLLGVKRQKRSTTAVWQCQCDCGREHMATAHTLGNHTADRGSCGCARNMIDLAGKRFERVLVVELAGKSAQGGTTWLCVCDCGTRWITSGHSLRRGHTRSCGCLRDELFQQYHQPRRAA